MKTIFQQILKAARARSPAPGVFSRNKKNGNGTFEPAPAYWAMIPLNTHTIGGAKRT